MRRIILFLTIIGFLTVLSSPVSAENTAGESANLAKINPQAQTETLKYLRAKKVIKKVLEKHGSPMVDATDDFIETCKQYQLDCYLLPAIAGVESTFGKFIYPNSYNAFGWARGYMMFDNWGEGINTVGKGLRYNYIDKGATDIQSIGKIYCELSSWAGKVTRILDEFYAEDKNLLYLEQNEVKL
jgi:hypothetical protein